MGLGSLELLPEELPVRADARERRPRSGRALRPLRPLRPRAPLLPRPLLLPRLRPRARDCLTRRSSPLASAPAPLAPPPFPSSTPAPLARELLGRRRSSPFSSTLAPLARELSGGLRTAAAFMRSGRSAFIWGGRLAFVGAHQQDVLRRNAGAQPRLYNPAQAMANRAIHAPNMACTRKHTRLISSQRLQCLMLNAR